MDFELGMAKRLLFPFLSSCLFVMCLLVPAIGITPTQHLQVTRCYKLQVAHHLLKPGYWQGLDIVHSYYWRSTPLYFVGLDLENRNSALLCREDTLCGFRSCGQIPVPGEQLDKGIGHWRSYARVCQPAVSAQAGDALKNT